MSEMRGIDCQGGYSFCEKKKERENSIGYKTQNVQGQNVEGPDKSNRKKRQQVTTKKSAVYPDIISARTHARQDKRWAMVL